MNPAGRGHRSLNTPFQRVRLFLTGAEFQVNRELAHFKAQVEQGVSKSRRCLAFLLGADWQVEQDEYPHDSVSA
jgi:hypothetical protein